MSADETRGRPTLGEVDELEKLLAEARRRLLRLDAGDRMDRVLREYRARRLRDECFGPHAALFGEPAWDLMLDLYVAMVEGKRISITSASVASCSPPSTAIRHVGFLERDGLVVRSQDDRDRRRSHVALSAEAVRMMDDWLDRTADDRD